MTREIKFRAWDRKKKQWHTCRNGGHMLDCSIDYKGIQTLQVQPYMVVQQFTGLKDRNGKEVYEGDLVDFGGLRPLKIVWRDSGFEAPLMPYENSSPIKLTQEGFSHFAEVVGNIYETPDLLK